MTAAAHEGNDFSLLFSTPTTACFTRYPDSSTYGAPQTTKMGTQKIGKFLYLATEFDQFTPFIGQAMTIAHGRTAKDFEATIASPTAFLYAASTMLLTRRLARSG